MELASYLTAPAFLVITLAMGGAGAWMTGRSVALGWRALVMVLLAMLPLAFAVRFLHYALAHEPLLAPGYVLVDIAVLLVIGSLGWLRTRAEQMVRQYPWLYEPAGPLGWRARTTKG